MDINVDEAHKELSTNQEKPVEHENEDSSSQTIPATPEDPVVGRLMSTLTTDSITPIKTNEQTIKSRTEDIPDIASLFASGMKRQETVFDGLVTQEIRSLQRTNQQNYDKTSKLMPDNALEESKTIGPYESVQDYVNDEPDSGIAGGEVVKEQEEDSSTPYPDAEPAYRYNIKVRSNGKVLDPPSK